MSDRRHWRVAVDVEGVRYTVTVFVYPTQELAREYLRRVDTDHEWDSPDGRLPLGAFWAEGFTLLRRMGDGTGGHAGTIVLCEDVMTVRTIAHECAHAGAHIYLRRFAKYSTRLLPHMHGSNEPLAYLIGDLAGEITHRVLRAGIDELRVCPPEKTRTGTGRAGAATPQRHWLVARPARKR